MGPELRLKLDAINGGKYGIKVDSGGSVTITRNKRSWFYLWANSKEVIDVRPMLEDVAAELAELREFRDAVVKLANCTLPHGKLVGFIERDDADNEDYPGSEKAYELVAGVVEPIVQAEDEAAGLRQYRWVQDDDEA